MAGVRVCERADLPAAATLFQRFLGNPDRPAPRRLLAYLEDVFFHSPWQDDELPSLVYEDDHGKVVGFLGVMPRRMRAGGRLIRVAVSSGLVVALQSRHTLAAIHLLKTFFSGPQELSFTDAANESACKIWEGLGGMTVPLYSLNWTRLLRPCHYGADLFVRKRASLAFLVRAARPACLAIDAIIARTRPNAFSASVKELVAENLPIDTLTMCITQSGQDFYLYPEYDSSNLKWVLELAGLKKRYGRLSAQLVRHQDGRMLGWYLCYLDPKGVSQVLQLGATRSSIHQVLSHLFYHAWRCGSFAVSGRIEPRFLHELSENYCSFKAAWRMLVHSRDPEILRNILRGNVFLTRLDGDWAMCVPELVN